MEARKSQLESWNTREERMSGFVESGTKGENTRAQNQYIERPNATSAVSETPNKVDFHSEPSISWGAVAREESFSVRLSHKRFESHPFDHFGTAALAAPMNYKLGSVYTPKMLAHWVADELISRLQRKKAHLILDPACGDGALLRSAKEAIGRATVRLAGIAILFKGGLDSEMSATARLLPALTLERMLKAFAGTDAAPDSARQGLGGIPEGKRRLCGRR